MIPKAIEGNLIIKCPVGSTVHGLHLPDKDDRDEMGVYIAPPEYKLGMVTQHDDKGKPFNVPLQHHIERTAGDDHTPSKPGDTDTTLYELGKFIRLACLGNPTVLILFFSEPSYSTPLGVALQRLHPYIVSQMCADRFKGYFRAQKERLLGVDGKRPSSNRPELVEAHGYDTKYAMHVLRLAEQGIEVLTTGHLTLPLPEPQRTEILRVRKGEVPFAVFKSIMDDAEARLFEAAESTELRREPLWSSVSDAMINMYSLWWGMSTVLRREQATRSLWWAL